MKLLIFSDIHGDKAALSKLMEIEADYYIAAGDLCNWGRGIDELGPILQKHAQKMYVIPGNHETADYVASFCQKFGFHNLHSKSMKIGSHYVAALGYSNPTPFDTPGEYTEEEIASRLEPFADLKPLILICHAPPLHSKLDLAGKDQHFGSTSVRAFIEKHQPDYFYCGHIHEAAGFEDTIGRTRGWNVGKRGKLLDLDALVE